MHYVFILTLGKLFAPLYIKGCPYNIFELKPAYGKMSIIVITIGIEVKFIPHCLIIYLDWYHRIAKDSRS